MRRRGAGRRGRYQQQTGRLLMPRPFMLIGEGARREFERRRPPSRRRSCYVLLVHGRWREARPPPRPGALENAAVVLMPVHLEARRTEEARKAAIRCWSAAYRRAHDTGDGGEEMRARYGEERCRLTRNGRSARCQGSDGNSAAPARGRPHGAKKSPCRTRRPARTPFEAGLQQAGARAAARRAAAEAGEGAGARR